MKKGRATRAVQILILVLAFGVFYIGLGVGLQVNTTWGTVLVALSLVIAAVDIGWMLRAKGGPR